MPYRSRYTGRYHTKDARKLDKRIDKLEKEAELKYYVTWASVPFVPAVAGTVILINDVPPGDAVNQRIGATVDCTSIHIAGLIQSSATATIDRVIRIMVFWWKGSTYGGTPNMYGDTNNGTLAVINTDGAATPNLYSTYSIEYAGGENYKVLYDQKFVSKVGQSLDYNSVGPVVTNAQTVLPFEFNIKLNRKTTFDSGAADPGIADITRNSLWLAFSSDNTTNGPLVNWTARLVFKDL